MEKETLPTLQFFDQLSDYYDQMVSWPGRIGVEGAFFKKLVTDYKLKSSLDVACSTGFHVIMFRRLGLDAVGIDASLKMIEKARVNSVTCGVTADFILGDIASLSKRFSEGFDIITCLGDTLPHFKSKKEIQRIFEEIHKCLSPGGLFVLHSRNYDAVCKTQERFLPPTGSRNGSEETIFFRLLDFHPKSLDYSVVRFRRYENRWETTTQTTEIVPHLKNDLETMLKTVGFRNLEFYRNFNFEDYDKNGTDLIVVAVKKGVLKPRPARKTTRRTSVSPQIAPRTSKVVAKSAKVPAKKSQQGRPAKKSRH